MSQVIDRNNRSNPIRKNKNENGTTSSNDDVDEYFESCLLNCAYAQYQADNEVKEYSPNRPKSKQLEEKKCEKPKDRHSMIQDVVLSISSSGSKSFDDDKSLLDLDSSSSL